MSFFSRKQIIACLVLFLSSMYLHAQPCGFQAKINYSGTNVSLDDTLRICDHDTMTLLASPSDASQYVYLWKSLSGKVIQNANATFIKQTVSDSIQLVIQDVNGCKDSAKVILLVRDNPYPIITYNKLTPDFCIGDSIILSSSKAKQYLWSSGDLTRSIKVQTTGNYTVTATNTNGCKASASLYVTGKQQPAAAIKITGPANKCDAGPFILQALPSNLTYLWNTGSINDSITVNTNATFTVTVTDNIGCSNTALQIVKLNPGNIASISPARDTMICEGQSVVYTASHGSSYAWSDGTIQQSNRITASGSYSVSVTDSLGCAAVSKTIVVKIIILPTANLSANGPTEFCEGGTVTLKVTSSANNYIWNTGAQMDSIVVTAAGSYKVTVTDDKGCYNTRSINVTVDPIPTAISVTALPSTTICNGGSIVLKETMNNALYKWSNGETAQSIIINTPGTYNYTVTVTSNKGCSASTTAPSVTVKPTPAEPVITLKAGTTNTLQCNVSGYTYKWYFYGTEITGATAQTYKAPYKGSYTVRITEIASPNCTNISQPYGYGLSDITTINAGSNISIYPNPVVDELTINFKNQKVGPVNITITDISGKVVQQVINQHIISENADLNIDCSQLAAGTYLIKIQSDEYIKILKIMKSQ